MSDLSPAAQSILNVYYKSSYIKSGLAAVIRELADQVVPHRGRCPMNEYMLGIRDAKQDVRDAILAIATELEGQ